MIGPTKVDRIILCDSRFEWNCLCKLYIKMMELNEIVPVNYGGSGGPGYGCTIMSVS